MAAIFGETYCFLKIGHSAAIPWGKNFIEIALSSPVFKIKAFLCFAIFAKNSKIQNGRHFGRDKIFFENCDAPLHSVGQKFRQNRSI